MVDQLFDYMRLTTESDALDVECCNVTEILASILADLYHAFEDKGWECQVDLNEELDSMVDPVALRRVFENILGNMLKHGSGDIRIKRFENTLDQLGIQLGRVLTISEKLATIMPCDS